MKAIWLVCIRVSLRTVTVVHTHHYLISYLPKSPPPFSGTLLFVRVGFSDCSMCRWAIYCYHHISLHKLKLCSYKRSISLEDLVQCHMLLWFFYWNSHRSPKETGSKVSTHKVLASNPLRLSCDTLLLTPCRLWLWESPSGRESVLPRSTYGTHPWKDVFLKLGLKSVCSWRDYLKPWSVYGTRDNLTLLQPRSSVFHVMCLCSVCLCSYMYMCMHVEARGQLQVHFSATLHIILLRQGLTKLTWSSWAFWSTSSRGAPDFTSPGLNLRHMLSDLDFMWVPEIQTQVFIFTKQNTLPTESSPQLAIFFS